MRVTNSMLASNLLSNLYSNLKHLNKYQNQLSTNSRIPRLSDDPIAAINSMQIGSNLSSNEQYSRNISDAKAWLNVTEDVLSEMNNVISRANEIAVQAGNGTYSREDRVAMTKEIEELQKHYVSMANTKFAGKYIFGGFNSTTSPFTVSGTTISYNSIADLSAATPAEIQDESGQIRQYKLSSDTKFDVSIPGIQVMGFGPDNIFNIFQGFLKELSTTAVTPELSEYITKFSDAQDKIITLIADVGGRQTRLDLMTGTYEGENLNLNELHTKIAGIDKAEVITHYKMAESSYNAALQVGAQIIQLSLVDFLR